MKTLNKATIWLPLLTVGLYVANYFAQTVEDPKALMWLGALVAVLHYFVDAHKVTENPDNATPKPETEP